jgi:hypothetical protein
VVFNMVTTRLSGVYSLSSLKECHLFLPPKEQEWMLVLHPLWLFLQLKLHLPKDLSLAVAELCSFPRSSIIKRGKGCLDLNLFCSHTCNLICCASPLLK